MLFLLLCSVALIKVSNAAAGNLRQATETIYIKILADTSEILVAWNDTEFSKGYNFFSYESVEISYQDAEANDAVPTKLVIPREDHGTKISVDTSKAYIFFIKYVTPSSKRCFPILVVSEYGDNKRRDIGVYDLLIKALPNEDWGFHGDRVAKMDSKRLITTGIASGLDDQELLSGVSYNKRYKTFLVGMKRTTAGSPVLWDMLKKECSTFRECYLNQWKREDPNSAINNFLELYGEAVPDKEHYKDGKVFGFAADNRIRYGTHSKKGNDYLHFGFGILGPPYVGFWGDKKDDSTSTPFYGYFLGQRETDFIESTSNECILPVCGIGFQMRVHKCKISHAPWNDIFCPPEMTDMTCIEKECPFDTPQNFRIEAREQTSIYLKWDAYDLIGLHAPEDFIFRIKVYDINNVHLQTQDRTRDNTEIIIYSLNPFSNYTFSIEGFSNMGNVKGNSTSISSSTKEGIPNDAASFTTAESINSSCMELRWDHIPKVNVLGNLRGYELTYYITTDSSNTMSVETGLVTEYMVCSLNPFSEYRFMLRARNSDHLSDRYDYIQNRTAESAPATAPTIELTTNSSNVSIFIKWNDIAPSEWNGVPYLFYVFYRVNGTKLFYNMTVQAVNKDADIPDLESYTLYDFQVAAATRAGIGPRSNIVTEITGEHLPLSRPGNITGEELNATSIVVRWSAVPKVLRKGIIIGYNVTCYSLNMTEIIQIIQILNGSQLTTNIYNLSAFTWYAVTVTAFTSVGAGPESNATLIQSGIGAPDGHPLLVTGYNLSSTSIFVRWDNISLDQWNGASDGFTIHISPPDISGGKRNYTRGITSAVITDLEKFQNYNISIECYNEKGSGPSSPAITILTDQSIPLKFERDVWGSDTGSYSLKVEWKELKNTRQWLGYPYRYHIYYRRAGVSEFTNEVVVNASTFEVEIDGLEGYREYEVAVAAATIIGVGPYSDVEVIKTGEAPPTGPTQNVTGAYNDSRSIHMNWTELLEEDTRGIITKYLVVCTTLDLVEMERRNVSSNDIRTTIFGGLEIYTPYLATVAAYTVAGLGPFSEPVTIWTDAEAPFRGPYNLTGYNTSSTSIYIKWDDISEMEWAGVIGHFRLTIQSIEDPNDKNITNITRKRNEKFFTYEAKDLKYFTVYQIEVACFNIKGVSPVSNITVVTEESWSVISPPSIHAVATGFNNVSVSWELPDETKIPGTIRGYTVRLVPIYTVEDLTIGTYSTRQRRSTSNELCADGQYCAGLQLQMDNITVSGSGTVSFNTSGLRGYTYYNISISVDTKFVGLASPPIQIFTPEGTPSMSAFNFTCEGVSYSSLLLQWKHSPPAYLEGIRTKYMIYYQFENKIVNETDEPYKRRMELFFLKANTKYTVWMTAFTSAGEGASTEKLNCSTFETEPTAAPTNVTATSFHYPYASLIQWEHIPDDQWQGSKQGYTIFYEKLSTGEVDVGDGWIKATRVDVPLTTSYVLEGLELYSVYRVRVAARSKSGVGFKSDPVRLETCHVPQAELVLNYMIYPPYVDYPKGNSLRPEGILIDLTEKMLLTCARTCISFHQSVYISYNRVDLDSFSDIKNFTINGTGLQVPRMDTGKFTPDYSLVKTTTSPGFILLEVPDSPAQAATKVEDGLLDGVFSTLPICALYFVINWLFGAMFWFCEPTKVEHRGRGMSLAGMFEGLYLAIMTSTTVGYGDKIPETTSGRIYIVFWTLLGLVLTGIVTGSLSSALSVASINSMKQKLPDDKVLALYGSAEYTYGKKKMKKFDTNVTYYSYEELFEPLRNESVKFALLDRYVAEILKTNISEYGLIVNKAFDVPTHFGVAAFGEMEKLKVCGVKFAKDNTDITSKAISKLLEELAKAKSGKNSSSASSSSSTSSTTEETADLISFQAPLYQKTFKIVLIIWAVFVMIGLIYEVFRRRRVNFIKNKIHTERELNLLRQTDLQNLFRESRKEFKEMITRVEDKIEKLNYKHGKQLLKMRTEMSKRYGVNFKYIKPSELGVPLEKILEYKEDLKNKPKDPFAVKFRKFRVSVASAFVRIIRFFRSKNIS